MDSNIGALVLAVVAALLAEPVGAQHDAPAATQPATEHTARSGQVRIPSFEQFARRHDRDKDGSVSRNEFRGPAMVFKLADADNDGVLTKAEYAAATQRLEQTQHEFLKWRGRGRRLPAGVKAIRNLEYAKVDRQSLKLDLYLPAKSKAAPPLLVWIHGGGWVKGSKSGVNLSMLRLSADGYAVASIDYRLTGLQSHPKQIHDCKGAIRWLRAKAGKYGYDATRIGAGGGSAGGHLVLLLGTSGGVKELEGNVGGNLDQSSKVQAMLDLYGPSDFALFAKGKARFAGNKAAKLIKSASPVTYISKDDPPLLIFQGDKDPLVPAAQSERMHKLYKKAGLKSQLHIIKGAGHGGPRFVDKTRSALVKAFFDKHIKQVKPAAKAEKATK